MAVGRTSAIGHQVVVLAQGSRQRGVVDDLVWRFRGVVETDEPDAVQCAVRFDAARSLECVFERAADEVRASDELGPGFAALTAGATAAFDPRVDTTDAMTELVRHRTQRPIVACNRAA